MTRPWPFIATSRSADDPIVRWFERERLMRETSDADRLEPVVWEPVHWTTTDRETFELGAMTARHRLNLWRYLHRHAEDYRHLAIEQGWQALAYCNGDMASMMIENDLARMEEAPAVEVLWDYYGDVLTRLAELICADTETEPISRLRLLYAGRH